MITETIVLIIMVLFSLLSTVILVFIGIKMKKDIEFGIIEYGFLGLGILLALLLLVMTVNAITVLNIAGT